MPDSDSPRPQFAIDFRVMVSLEFDQDELEGIGWHKFFKGLDARGAETPLELARMAFIDLMLSPEVDPNNSDNDYSVRVGACVFGYLTDKYARSASRDQANELAKRWARRKSGSGATKPISDWFDEVYGGEEWPRKPKLF